MNRKNQNQIDCGTALEWIHLSLDQELPQLDHQKLQSHLQNCKDCSAAQRELSLLENAHAELDKPIAAVPASYFEALPERVLARIAKAEARRGRAFSLPKPQLPKWRTPGWLHALIFGRGKYALAFAAVALLAFIITSRLRQTPSSETVLLEPSAAAPPPTVVEKPSVAAPPTGAQARRDFAEAEKTPAPSEAETQAAARQHLAKLTTLQAADEARANMAGGENEAIVSEQERGEQKDNAAMTLAPTTTSELNRVAFEDSGSRTAYSLDAVQRADVVSPQSAAGAGAAARSAAEMYIPASNTPVKMNSKSVYSPAPASASAALFTRTAQQAASAPSEPQRRKIWQGFLSTNPDSVHYYFAVTEIGRSFAAEIDSTTRRAGVEEALQFYSKMKAVLASQLGQEAVANEQARLEGLLRWKEK